MNHKRYLLLVAAALLAFDARAQNASAGLVACLDLNGTLFNVAPAGTPREPCPDGSNAVDLGTVSTIDVGDSLTSKVQGGNVFLDVNPELAIPPSCPPGQVALSDNQGGWVCTPPAFGGQRNPGSKVWVVSHIDYCVDKKAENGGRPSPFEPCASSESFTWVNFVNPGAGTASVSCYFFDQNGVFQLDLVQTQSVPSGGQSLCYSPKLPFGSTRYYAWALIVASQPVLPTVRSHWTDIFGQKNAAKSAQVEAYPVNCDEPEGHEFVCQFAQ